MTGTSTVYDEAFTDPLSNRRYPTGVDSTGASAQGKQLPQGFIKTPDTVQRGSGRPLDQQINAQDQKLAAKQNKSAIGRFVSGEQTIAIPGTPSKENRNGKSSKNSDDPKKKKSVQDREYLLGN